MCPIPLHYTEDTLRERTDARQKNSRKGTYVDLISGSLRAQSDEWYQTIAQAILDAFREGIDSCALTYTGRDNPEVYYDELLTWLRDCFGHSAQVKFGSYISSARTIQIVINFSEIPDSITH